MHRRLAPSENTFTKKVSDVCSYPRNWAEIFRGGVHTGLKWGDVDLESGTLQVRRTLTTAKG